jgi:dTDP-4-amino-4,6-dideoxygalactose transaminase
MPFSVPIFKPSLPSGDQIQNFLRDIDSNQIYSNFGPLSKSLEEKVGNFLKIDKEHIVSISSATLALEAALITSGTKEKWFCPSWTFVATPLSLKRSNKKFEFADVDLNYRLDVTNLPKKVFNLIDVLPFGDNLNLSRIPDNTNMLLVDAAASIANLSELDILSYPKRIGLVISLHATKIISSGEGGLFISNDLEWVRNVRQWQNFGFNDFRVCEMIGTNAKMSEYSSAVGLASLSSWEIDKVIWKNKQDKIRIISNNNNLKLAPSISKGLLSPYWIIEAPEKQILRIKNIFDRNGVQTRAWWGEGCHKLSIFKNIRKSNLVNTNKLSRTTLGLPFFKEIPYETLDYLDDLIKKAS